MKPENTENPVYDCIVVGGGISGISFAHYLKKWGQDVLILEKEKDTGGQIQSVPSATTEGYWRELGAHTCYNSYTGLLSIVKDIAATEKIQLLGKGSYMLYSPKGIKRIASEISFPTMLFSCPKIFLVSKKNKTVKEFFTKVTGKKNYNRLFYKLFRAVISQKADDYPAELFLKRRKDRFKEFPRKYTFRDGLSGFLLAIIEADQLKIHKEAAVIRVEQIITDTGNSIYKVETAGKNTYYCKNIAFACDPQTTAVLLKNIEDRTAGLLQTIPLFESESINVIVKKEKLDIPVLAGIIPMNDDFLSAVSRDLVEDEDLRSFTFHFETDKREIEEKMKIICKVHGIEQTDIVEHTRMNHTLPSLKLRHLNMEGQIDNARINSSVYITGNYFYGLSIEDCINRSHKEASRFEENIKTGQ